MRALRRTRHRAGCAVPPLPENTAAHAPWASATQMPHSRRRGRWFPRAPPAPSSRQRANAALTGSGSISLPHIPGVPCRGNVSTPCVPRGQVVAIFRRNASPGCRPWQYFAVVRFRGGPVVARLCRGAFPGGDPWRLFRRGAFFGRSSMAKRSRNAFPRRPTVARSRRDAFSGCRPWQDFAAMRSRAAGHGKISLRCVPGRRSVAAFSLHAFPKGPRTGKAPLPGRISPPCIRNEPALARYARHASEKPRKSPSEDTPREDLARKGPFSLRVPLKSCTARRSCRRSALERERIGQSQKIVGVLARTRSKVVTSY